MSVEYYYVNDLNRLYNAAVGDKTDGDEHHVRMMEARDNLDSYMQKLEHWKDTALQLSRNNGEAQAKIQALEAEYAISNRELLIKQVEINRQSARIAELEAERRWIPVSERLPEEKQSVLALDRTGTAYHWEYSRSLSNIFVGYYTHWMPLPESPNDTQTQTIVYGKEREE